MKNILKYCRTAAVLWAAAGFALFTSCSEETLNADRDYYGLGGNPTENTQLDQWLYENYVEPYNIEVKYKWNPNELTTAAQLVPVFETLVRPTMELISDVWFQPYLDTAGEDFLKEMAPKWIYLVGSPQYNEDGSEVLGKAEGAMKIILYDVNNYNATNEAWLRELLQTIEHEFAHILHQTVDYSSQFKEISAGSYTTTGWVNYGETTALLEGFYSPYAMSDPDEDFVETLSLLMVNGMEWRQNRMDWLQYYATLPADPDETAEETAYRIALSAMAQQAIGRLLEKEAQVEKYMKDVWGIQFFDSSTDKGLVSHVQDAIDKVLASTY